MMQAAEMNRIMEEYRRLRSVVPLGTLHTKKEYKLAVQMLDAILDEIGEDERHPLAELADAISVFVERYEADHVSSLAGDPSEVLRLLTREHELRQSDLPEIGSQGVVSEVLAGKRDLNTRQIRALAKRFGVSPAVFV
jgi:HTH-type transcriptional regulator/antitoxin HigA